MNAQRFAAQLDPGRIMRAAGMRPDPWQRELLYAKEPLVLVNCSRQIGKSTTVGAKALHQSLFDDSLTLIVAPSERQSKELLRKVRDFIRSAGDILKIERDLRLEIEFENGSRIVALPGAEETVRGFSAVSLIIIDEAAYVPDAIYRGVRPMLAVSQGQLVALTTPKGKRGYFYEAWEDDETLARRIIITWEGCSDRIPASFIEAERRALGPFFEQEYEGAFLDLTGAVFPSDLIDRAFADDVDLDALGIDTSPPGMALDECEALEI